MPFVAGAIVAAAGLVGCAESGPSLPAGVPRLSGSPERTATPTPPPDPSAGAADCVTIASYSSAPPPTTDVMRLVDVIAPGTVDRIDPAEWNTPSNVRPDMVAVQSGRSLAIIWRPVHVTFEAPWQGALNDVSRTIVRGGMVGCDYYATDDDPNLVPGARDVLFLFEITDSTGTRSGIMNIVEAWPIRSGGTVVRPVEEPIALDELRTLLVRPRP